MRSQEFSHSHITFEHNSESAQIEKQSRKSERKVAGKIMEMKNTEHKKFKRQEKILREGEI